MKSSSNIKPSPILDLGNGKYHINYNVVENETEEHGVMYDYDTVMIEGCPTYENIVNALIRSIYTLSDELSIQRQRDTKTGEFAEYCEYADSCKVIAKGCLREQR